MDRLGTWLCICTVAEAFKTCIDVFLSFYKLSAECWSTKENMMSTNLQSFSVVVNLEIDVDYFERYPRNLTIALKISYLICTK